MELIVPMIDETSYQVDVEVRGPQVAFINDTKGFENQVSGHTTRAVELLQTDFMGGSEPRLVDKRV